MAPFVILAVEFEPDAGAMWQATNGNVRHVHRLEVITALLFATSSRLLPCPGRRLGLCWILSVITSGGSLKRQVQKALYIKQRRAKNAISRRDRC